MKVLEEVRWRVRVEVLYVIVIVVVDCWISVVDIIIVVMAPIVVEPGEVTCKLKDLKQCC